MQLLFSGQTHNSFGGGPVSYVADLLQAEDPVFGSALETIELTVFYPGASASAHSSIPYEPPENDTRRFERKRKLLRVLWISRRQSEALASGVYSQNITHNILLGAFDDATDAIRFGLARLSNTDDFDTGRFLSWLIEMRERPWGDERDLQTKLLEASEKSRETWRVREKTEPWASLGVDWWQMAPNARTILNEPIDWSDTDDLSPHGNDTGSDILAAWSRFAHLTAEAAAKEIGWGNELDLRSDASWQTWVEINLALAFGHIKKTGNCPKDIAAKAHHVLSEAITRTKGSSSWQCREEVVARAERYRSILVQYI